MKSIVTILFAAFFALQSSAQCLPLSNAKGGKKQQIFTTTGVVELDKLLNLEKACIETVFKIKVELKILDDSDAPNAYATEESSNPFFFGGTVYMGQELLTKELWKRKNGMDAVRGIMAHEFAHILQSSLNCKLEGAILELHADFMAGYYLGIKDIVTQKESLKTFAESLFEKGDGELWDASHHGTPKQRVMAMTGGYLAAKKAMTPKEAYLMGIDLLTNGGDDGTLPTNEGEEKPTTPSVREPETEEVSVSMNDGRKYKNVYSIGWSLDDATYKGLLLLDENDNGVVRLRYNNTQSNLEEIVHQTVTFKTLDNGIQYLDCADPIDVLKKIYSKTYAADKFYFTKNAKGETEIWNIDDKFVKVKVDILAVKTNALAQQWLKYLNW